MIISVPATRRGRFRLPTTGRHSQMQRRAGYKRCQATARVISLRQLGCRYGQGYLFGRPTPAEDVERLLFKESAGPPQLSLASTARS